MGEADDVSVADDLLGPDLIQRAAATVKEETVAPLRAQARLPAANRSPDRQPRSEASC